MPDILSYQQQVPKPRSSVLPLVALIYCIVIVPFAGHFVPVNRGLFNLVIAGASGIIFSILVRLIIKKTRRDRICGNLAICAALFWTLLPYIVVWIWLTFGT